VSEIRIKTKKFDERLVDFMKKIKGRWDPNGKEWIIDRSKLEELKNKVKELKLEDAVIIPDVKAIKEGSIIMSLSKDGKYALIRLNLIAFREDIEQLLKGRRNYVKFRILPYKKKSSKR